MNRYSPWLQSVFGFGSISQGDKGMLIEDGEVDLAAGALLKCVLVGCGCEHSTCLNVNNTVKAPNAMVFKLDNDSEQL